MQRSQPRNRSGEKGAIAVLMGLMLTVIMGFSALGFDLAYVRLARLEMKTVSDASAHAAMLVLRLKHGDQGVARDSAQQLSKKNFVLGHRVTLEDSDVVFGLWDYDTATFVPGSSPVNSVRIKGRKSDPGSSDGTVRTTLGRAITPEATVAQESYGAYRTRSLMFEMDVTGSFLTASCGIDEAIAADVAFLDALKLAGSPKDKIGLDVFTGRARNFTPLQNLAAGYTDIRSSWVGDGGSAKTAAHKSGLGVCTQTGEKTTGDWVCGGGNWPNQDYLDGLAATKPMPTCWEGDFHFAPTVAGVFGGTNMGAGIASALAAFEADGEKLYEARSIVVFTDGGPLCCEARGGGDICPGANPCCADSTKVGTCTDNTGGKACDCSAAIRDYGVAQAELAASRGIDVYTLAFGGNPQWVAYAKGLARGRGFGLSTNNKADLQVNLEKIANAIPIALVK